MSTAVMDEWIVTFRWTVTFFEDIFFRQHIECKKHSRNHLFQYWTYHAQWECHWLTGSSPVRLTVADERGERERLDSGYYKGSMAAHEQMLTTGQKRPLALLKQKWKMIKSQHAGAGNKIWIFCKASKLLSCISKLS